MILDAIDMTTVKNSTISISVTIIEGDKSGLTFGCPAAKPDVFAFEKRHPFFWGNF